MKKVWTEAKALKALGLNVTVEGKVIKAKEGLFGLTACGACDFLVNHCKYTYVNVMK
jgi:hypothetical protein